MITTLNHDEEEPRPGTDKCCDDHSLLCSVADSNLDACCANCPEWGEPLWH